MKKMFQFVLVLGILVLIFQFGTNLLKKGHTITYTLSNNVNVKEKYIKTKEYDYYKFNVEWDKHIYNFDVSNTFNKQKKVINEFLTYVDEEIYCISPIYINDEVESKIYCHNGDEQVLYSTIKDKHDFSELLSKLKNYDEKKYTNGTKSTKVGVIEYYDNFLENEYVVLYNYKDLLVFNKNKFNDLVFSNYDIYQNEIGRLVDNYYVLPNHENKVEYGSFYIIDILNKSKELLLFDQSLSTNIYVNGVVDKHIYITDKSNYIQYEINPINYSYREIGNKEDGGQYYNGVEWSTESIYSFVNNELLFKKDFENVPFNYVNCYETELFYYYNNSKGEFYKLYKDDLNNPIYIFTEKKAKEVIVNDNGLYYIKNNYLYRYDEYGKKLLLINSELEYNYTNIYSVDIK